MPPLRPSLLMRSPPPLPPPSPQSLPSLRFLPLDRFHSCHRCRCYPHCCCYPCCHRFDGSLRLVHSHPRCHCYPCCHRFDGYPSIAFIPALAAVATLAAHHHQQPAGNWPEPRDTARQNNTCYSSLEANRSASLFLLIRYQLGSDKSCVR